MKINRLIVGPIQANCYVVYEEKTKEALVIDPGAEGTRIYQEIEDLGLKVKYIVNTHGHLDHIGGNEVLKKATGAQLCIHQADSAMLTNPKNNFSFFSGKGEVRSPEADEFVQDGDILEVGELQFQILHTPGHSLGGICIVGEGVCFSGDTLFTESVGRTDLPGGSTEELLTSIREKLLGLAEETIVYPGHGPQTTIGHEKKANPYLQ